MNRIRSGNMSDLNETRAQSIENRTGANNNTGGVKVNQDQFMNSRLVVPYFDIIPRLIESSSLVDNTILTSKIFKMFDSIQRYFEINNDHLNDHLAQTRENEKIEISHKSSELTHRQHLQTLLITALNKNQIGKAMCIGSILDPNLSLTSTSAIYDQQPIAVESKSSSSSSGNDSQTSANPSGGSGTANTHSNHSMMTRRSIQMNRLLSTENTAKTAAQTEDNANKSHESVEVIDEPVVEVSRLTNGYGSVDAYDYHDNKIEPSTSTNHESMEESRTNGDSSGNVSCNAIRNLPRLENPFRNQNNRSRKKRAKFLGPLSPIRHLICSPGLEKNAHMFNIIILYRGTCNGQCYENKPWSKQVHLHYIVNTVNCNDHISRLVKKLGIEFYNSFVLQNPERRNQLIQLYQMERVKPV